MRAGVPGVKRGIWVMAGLVALFAAGVRASPPSTGTQAGAGTAPSCGAAQQYLKHGEERAGAHDYDGAIAAYERAMQLKPDYAEAYNDRGHAYYWKGDGARAIADFTRAIELRPVYPNAYNNRGAAYMASGNAAKAILDFDRALALKPDFRNAYVNRANAHLRLRHVRQALGDFHRAGMHPERALVVAGGAILLMILAGAAVLARRKHRVAGKPAER